MTTLAELEQLVLQLRDQIDALSSRQVPAAQVFAPGGLSDITSNAGILRQGEFIASLGNLDPNHPQFTGTFVSAYGRLINGVLFHLASLKAGTLQIGWNALNGSMVFAENAGQIDQEGIKTSGLRYAIRQLATYGAATRYGWLEMFLPQGASVPAWALSYSDTLVGLVTNGDAETGDLTGWTDSGTSFSVVSDAAFSGTYGIKCTDIPSGTETLTSARFAVSAGAQYRVSFKTNEHSYQSGSGTKLLTADAPLEQANPTSNFGSITSNTVGEVSGTSELIRTAVKFDVSDLDYYTSIQAANMNFYVAIDKSANARTMKAYRILRDWIEGDNSSGSGVTWNTWDGVNAWTTAGCGDTTTDRDSAEVGTVAFGASEAQYTKKTMALDVAVLGSWIQGSLDNYGLLLKMDTESNDAYTLYSRHTSSGYHPYVDYTWTLPSAYSILLKYYDAASGGTLLDTVTLGVQSNQSGWIERIVGSVAPSGATHAEIVISASQGKGFYIDEIAMSVLTALYFDDSGLNYVGSSFYHRQNDSRYKFISADCQLPRPPAPVAGTPTTGGAVDVGTHSYVQTYYDSFGESPRSNSSNVVTIANTTNDRVPLTVRLGPAGTVGRRIYRTVAGDTGDWKLLVDIPNNTATTYNDDIADAALGAAAPTTNTTAGRPMFPRNTIIQAEEFYGVPDFTFTNSQVLGYYKQNNSAADGDTYHAWFYADAGADYEVGIFYVKANNAGKMNMFIDEAAIDGGTAFDMYAASTTYNQTKYYTSLTIGQAGMHRITIKANGKNGSSSGYRMPFTMIEIKRASV